MSESDIFLSSTNSSFAVLAYGLMATTVITIVKYLPKNVSTATLFSRIKFAFIYASVNRIQSIVLEHNQMAVLTCVFAGIWTLLTHYMVAENEDTANLNPAILLLASFAKIMQQLLLSLSVALLISNTNRSTLEDVAYSLGVVVLVSFIVSFSKSESWKSFALWRIGDLIVADFQSSTKLGMNVIATSLWVCNYFISNLYFLLYGRDNKENVYLQLLYLLSASTLTRALLQLTQSMPVIDLVTLRFFIVLIFF